MKIFAIYLRLHLTPHPEWFDNFRNKYSSNSILHITLVQPRYVSENSIEDLKNIVTEALHSNTLRAEDKKIIFHKTELEWDEDDNQYLLMSLIKENQSVLKLQKDLVSALKRFDIYCNESTKEYESNFRPHLTVGDRIDVHSKEEALECISEMNGLEGGVTDLVLAVVNEQTIPEAENPDNWSVFRV